MPSANRGVAYIEPGVVSVTASTSRASSSATVRGCIPNATVISLDDAPTGYAEFDSSVAQKFVIDLHGLVAA